MSLLQLYGLLASTLQYPSYTPLSACSKDSLKLNTWPQSHFPFSFCHLMSLLQLYGLLASTLQYPSYTPLSACSKDSLKRFWLSAIIATPILSIYLPSQQELHFRPEILRQQKRTWYSCHQHQAQTWKELAFQSRLG